MTFTVTLPSLEAIPIGCQILSIIVLWYVFAAMIVRWTGAVSAFLGAGSNVNTFDRGMFWLFSPLLIPLLVVAGFVAIIDRFILTPPKSRR